MKIMLELFSGSGNMANAFKGLGWGIETLDNGDNIKATHRMDIRDYYTQKPFSVVWASPPCQAFSLAACGHHWPNNKPGEKAKESIELLKHTIAIIESINPDIWFIENPVGKMNSLKFLKRFDRYTITFCQYGDKRRKPTNIWTNAPIDFLKPCSNGDPCHESAPRGSKTGTQGLKDAYERGKLPKAFCEDIAKQCNWLIDNGFTAYTQEMLTDVFKS